jgi:hypothetical protein
VSVIIVKIIVVEMVMVSVAEVLEGSPLTTASEPYTNFPSTKLFMNHFSCLLASRDRYPSKRPKIHIKRIE